MTCCEGDKLGPKLEGLLACVLGALEECGKPVCRYFISTAPVVPWDVCCACNSGVGQLWVGVDAINPQLTGTNGAEVKCNTQYEANVWVGLLRCALTQDDNGDPPNPDALIEESMGILQDRLIVTQAIRCCYGAVNEVADFTIRSWEPLAGGGCVGGRLNVTIRFGDPRCS